MNYKESKGATSQRGAYFGNFVVLFILMWGGKMSALAKSSEVKNVLDSLEAGDGLHAMMFVEERWMATRLSVLRRDQDLLYLSLSSVDEQWLSALSDASPFHWDASKSALVDRDGFIQEWCGSSMRVEKGAAAKASEQYELVPRMSADIVGVDPRLYKGLCDSPLADVANGILYNGEAGTLDTQLELFLGVIGLSLCSERLAELTLFCDLLVTSAIDPVVLEEMERVALRIYQSQGGDILGITEQSVVGSHSKERLN